MVREFSTEGFTGVAVGIYFDVKGMVFSEESESVNGLV